MDAQGKGRPLQLSEAIECLHYDRAEGKRTPETVHIGGAEVTTYMKTESFTVRRWRIKGEATLPLEGYAVLTVTRGSGMLNGRAVKTGDNILLTALKNTHSVSGDMDILMTLE